jgi:hypothetical protein
MTADVIEFPASCNGLSPKQRQMLRECAARFREAVEQNRRCADDLDRLCTKRKLSVADTRLIKFMIGEIGLEEFNAS